MFLILQLIIVCLISKITKSEYGSTHAVIGNYVDLNPEDCGITRLTDGFNDMCFEWHKNPIPSIKAGRDATEDEVPWMAVILLMGYIQYPNWQMEYVAGLCSGSLVANQWIITAAHCTPSLNTSRYRIHFGHAPFNSTDRNYSICEVRNYPGNDTDLSLLKLSHPLNATSGVKSICLPKSNIQNEGHEYGLSAGWGLMESSSEKHNVEKRFKKPLQMGYKKLLPVNTTIEINGTVYSLLNLSDRIFSTEIDNQTLSCKGDSGGPLWQLSMGRAVLIGVITSVTSSPNSSCQSIADTMNYSLSIFVRVSYFIDWIMNVTSNKEINF